jgi:hypothetical protein
MLSKYNFENRNQILLKYNILKTIKSLIFIYFCLFAGYSWSQRTDNSPYSRFGIGDLRSTTPISAMLMGGMGSSFADPFHANFRNPASLSFLNTTAYEVAINAKYSQISDGNSSVNQWGGTLDYFSLAFPLRNPIMEAYEGKKPVKYAMGFSLFRNSTVGYDLSSREFLEGVGVFNRDYFGTGGTYKFNWAFSARYKDFSLGVSTGYLFGKISYERNLRFEDLVLPFNNLFTTDYSVSGLYYDAGIMYSKVLNKEKAEKDPRVSPKKLNIGLRINPAHNFNTTSNISEFAVQRVGNFPVTDTLFFETGTRGKGRIPLEYGGGINYMGSEKWLLGLEYNRQIWSEYFNDGNNESSGSLQNTFNMSFGGFYRPDFKSLENYWKRVFYRFGAFYHKDPRVVSGNQLDDFGITLGTGLPFIFQRKSSFANLGFVLGYKGRNTPVEERYARIHFAFTFNDDEWFIKRKYN